MSKDTEVGRKWPPPRANYVHEPKRGLRESIDVGRQHQPADRRAAEQVAPHLAVDEIAGEPGSHAARGEREEERQQDVEPPQELDA